MRFIRVPRLNVYRNAHPQDEEALTPGDQEKLRELERENRELRMQKESREGLWPSYANDQRYGGIANPELGRATRRDRVERHRVGEHRIWHVEFALCPTHRIRR
ncbi:MAG: hypothetical protein ACRDP8_06440 [Actinopolymorphaceae bacterium]